MHWLRLLKFQQPIMLVAPETDNCASDVKTLLAKDVDWKSTTGKGCRMGESNLKYNRIGPTSSRSEKLSNWTNQVDQIEFFAFVVYQLLFMVTQLNCYRPAFVLDRFSALLLVYEACNSCCPEQSCYIVTLWKIVTPVVQDNPGEAVEAANPSRVERLDEAHLWRCRRLPRPRYAHNWKGFTNFVFDGIVTKALTGGAQSWGIWSITRKIGQRPSSTSATGVDIQVNHCQ